MSRKPTPPKGNSQNVRTSASTLVNEFMQERNIVWGLGDMKISYTNTGTVIIDKPQVIIVYADEVGNVPTQEKKLKN